MLMYSLITEWGSLSHNFKSFEMKGKKGCDTSIPLVHTMTRITCWIFPRECRLHLLGSCFLWIDSMT